MRPARGRQLSVPDDRQPPAAFAVRTCRNHLADARECAQSLAAPEHLNGFGGVIPEPGCGFVAGAVGEVGDVRQHESQRMAVGALDQGPGT